jgi:hypothetical protein
MTNPFVWNKQAETESASEEVSEADCDSCDRRPGDYGDAAAAAAAFAAAFAATTATTTGTATANAVVEVTKPVGG